MADSRADVLLAFRASHLDLARAFDEMRAPSEQTICNCEDVLDDVQKLIDIFEKRIADRPYLSKETIKHANAYEGS